MEIIIRLEDTTIVYTIYRKSRYSSQRKHRIAITKNLDAVRSNQVTLTLTLIHPASNWTHWATLRRHPYLSRAATSASSEVNPIFCRSLLTVLLQFALGRPGPLLYPGTCQYSACCGMRWWSIRKTRPSQQSRLSLSMLSMVCCPVLVLTSTFVILSFHECVKII